MQDFLNPAYFAAVGSAVGYGFCVFLGMLVVASAYVFASGGPAAKKWEEHSH